MVNKPKVNVNFGLVVSLGPRLIRVEGQVLGECDNLSFTIALSTPEELNRLRNAEVIELVKAMDETEARKVAAELGIRYDGIQERVGHQFTDTQVTGTTFYGNSPSQVKAGLEAKRNLWKASGKRKMSDDEEEPDND